MQAPALEPSGFGPRGDAQPLRAPTRLENIRNAPAPGWSTTLAIALIVAIVASGLMYWLQQSRVDDALEKRQQAVTTLAETQRTSAGSATDVAALNERLATQVQRATAAERRVARLESVTRRQDAAIARAESQLGGAEARVAALTTARAAAQQRLDAAFAARRAAVAEATALIGAPLAAGRHVTRFETFGGTQSPPMAVVNLQGNPEWRVVAVAPAAIVRVLGKNGLHRISLAQLTERFAKSASRPNDITRSQYRIAVNRGHITAITELH